MAIRAQTQNAYLTGLTCVLAHILRNLDEPQDPAALANIACFSLFHCHRIFRGMMGESIGEFVKRMRLERAAWRLSHGTSVTEVAFEAGYESHAAFTRAFGEVFAVPPSLYVKRRMTAFEIPNPTGIHYDPSGRPPVVRPMKSDASMPVEIRMQPSIRVAALAHRGPYWQIGPVLSDVFQWAMRQGLAGRVGVGIYYDCPHITPPSERRSDACIIVPEDYTIPPEAPVREVVVPSGAYAVAAHVGSYSGIGESWTRFIGSWLPQSCCRTMEGFDFEIYVDDCATVPIEEVRTELCIPVVS